MEKSTISIIIPAWNEQIIIEKTCNYLKKLKLPFEYTELILVAGGTDNSYEICQKLKFENFTETKILKQDPGDFKSGALVKGIKESKGDLIIIIDADVFIASNLVVEIVKKITNFDVVCCDFIPMMEKGFWHSYYTLFKLNWAKDPNNLRSLIGGATISLKKEVINEIGIENFFTSKTTAGVDYFMGFVLRRNNKRIGLVKNTRCLVPRPNNIRDYIKDQRRWLTAYYSIHWDDFSLVMFNLVFNISYCLFPPLLFLSNIKKLQNLKTREASKLKYFIILFFVEFIINFMSIIAFVKKKTGKLKDLGHFKGEDRYLS